jgi:hypothetical protein
MISSYINYIIKYDIILFKLNNNKPNNNKPNNDKPNNNKPNNNKLNNNKLIQDYYSRITELKSLKALKQQETNRLKSPVSYNQKMCKNAY